MAEIIDQGLRVISCFKPGIRAVYTTKSGGFSKGAYASFNLGSHVGDDPRAVAKNRDYLCRALKRKVIFMNQTHGSAVKEVDGSKTLIDADGIFTADRSVALAVMTADCLPLLLAADDLSGVCAVHCGWRGLAGGIVKNAVGLMRLKSQAKLTAFLGPAIGPESFEVGYEIEALFSKLSPCFASAFKPKGCGKFLCSIYEICSLQLNALGVTDIHCDYFDTFKDQNLFFSYRRSKTTGRMASVIGLD